MKKIISLVLAVLMLVSAIPMAASAAYHCPDYIHNWDYSTKVSYEATCTSRAYSTIECMDCGAVNTQEFGPLVPHTDKDHNGRCDVCDADTTIGCHHFCHTGGFFYKIARFFWKLFKTNKECECGMYHY